MQLDEATERAIADRCREVVREYDIPAISVAVTDQRETVFASGYGSRDRATNRPATPRTLYGIGSVTKSFAAVALLQLVESGMCDLEDPVADHLDVDLAGDDHDEPVTLHHLLTHASGLPSLGVSETLLARRLRHPDPGIAMGDDDDFYAHLDGSGDERVAPPGERFAYCNSGYALVGRVVESLTGRPFDEYVTEHVFGPVGMERATFDDMEFSRDDDHMTQYLQEDGELVAASLPTRDVGQPAGGILASVEEVADYVRMHLNGGDADGTRVVGADLLDRAHAGHVDTGTGSRYGYGWFRDGGFCGDRTLVGHSGSIAVSSAYAGFLPEPGVGVALAANTSPSFALGVVGEAVLATLLGEDPDQAVPFFARQRRHEELTGEYEAYRGVMAATVERDGDGLRVEFDHPLKRGGSALFPAEDGVVAGGSDGDAGADGANPLDGDATTYRYRTLGPSGEHQPVVFRETDDDLSLLVDRWRLHKVGG